jgi:hypothetical protein
MSGLVVLLLHVLLVSLASALVVQKSITLRQWTDFEQFGFAANGHIALTASTSTPQKNVSLLICTDKEFDKLSTAPDVDFGYCTPNDLRECEYTADYSIPVNYHVKYKDRYRIFKYELILPHRDIS